MFKHAREEWANAVNAQLPEGQRVVGWKLLPLPAIGPWKGTIPTFQPAEYLGELPPGEDEAEEEVEEDSDEA